MKRIFSIEEKMSAIGLVFQGESARSVSRKLHLGHHILYEWIESYKLRGIEGLRKNTIQAITQILFCFIYRNNDRDLRMINHTFSLMNFCICYFSEYIQSIGLMLAYNGFKGVLSFRYLSKSATALTTLIFIGLLSIR